MTYNIIDSSVKQWYKDTTYKSNVDVVFNGITYTSLVYENKGNNPVDTLNQYWKEKSYAEQYLPESQRSDTYFSDQIMILDYILKNFSIITDDKAVVSPQEIANLAETINPNTDYGGLSRWTGVLYPLLGSKFSIEAIPMIAQLQSRLYEWSDNIIKSDISLVRSLGPTYSLPSLLEVEVNKVLLSVFDNDNSVLHDDAKFYIWFREFNNNVNFNNIKSLYSTIVESTTIADDKEVHEIHIPYKLLQYDVLTVTVNGNIVKFDENVYLSSENSVRFKYLNLGDVIDISINLLESVWFANGIFKNRIYVAPRLKDKGAFGLDFYDYLDDKLYKDVCDAIHDLKWIGKDFTYLSSTTSPMQLSLSTYYEYENRPGLGKHNPYTLGKDYVGTPALSKYKTSSIFTQRVTVSELEQVDSSINYTPDETTYVSLSKIPINTIKDMSLMECNEFIDSPIIDSYLRVEVKDSKVEYVFDDLYLTIDKLPFEVKSYLINKYDKYDYVFSKDFHEHSSNNLYDLTTSNDPASNIKRVSKNSLMLSNLTTSIYVKLIGTKTTTSEGGVLEYKLIIVNENNEPVLLKENLLVKLHYDHITSTTSDIYRVDSVMIYKNTSESLFGITTKEDLLIEGSEQFLLNIKSITLESDLYQLTTGNIKRAEFDESNIINTITNTAPKQFFDVVIQSVNSTTQLEGDNISLNISIIDSVTRLPAVMNTDLVINLDYSNITTTSSDYNLVNSVVVPKFTSFKTINIGTYTDNLLEGLEKFIVSISSVSSTDVVNYTSTIDCFIADVTPIENVNISLQGVVTTATEGSNLQLKVLAKDPNNVSKVLTTDLVVNLLYTYTSASSSDIVEVNSITIPAGSSESTITVATVKDSLLESVESVTISISSITNYDVIQPSGYRRIASIVPSPVTCSINNAAAVTTYYSLAFTIADNFIKEGFPISASLKLYTSGVLTTCSQDLTVSISYTEYTNISTANINEVYSVVLPANTSELTFLIPTIDTGLITNTTGGSVIIQPSGIDVSQIILPNGDINKYNVFGGKICFITINDHVVPTPVISSSIYTYLSVIDRFQNQGETIEFAANIDSVLPYDLVVPIKYDYSIAGQNNVTKTRQATPSNIVQVNSVTIPAGSKLAKFYVYINITSSATTAPYHTPDTNDLSFTVGVNKPEYEDEVLPDGTIRRIIYAVATITCTIQVK